MFGKGRTVLGCCLRAVTVHAMLSHVSLKIHSLGGIGVGKEKTDFRISPSRIIGTTSIWTKMNQNIFHS